MFNKVVQTLCTEPKKYNFFAIEACIRFKDIILIEC